MQLYPDWSSRANTTRGKKRKRKQETNDGGMQLMKQNRPQPDLPIFSLFVACFFQGGKEPHESLAYLNYKKSYFFLEKGMGICFSIQGTYSA